MVNIVRDKETQNYINKLKNELDLTKSLYDPKYIFKKLQEGFYLHEIIGVDIPLKYVKDVYKNITDEELYGNKLYYGNLQKKEKGLKDYLGNENSTQRQNIQNAQDDRLNEQEKRENWSAEDWQKGEDFEKKEEGEEPKQEESKDEEKKDQPGEEKEDEGEEVKKAVEDTTKEQPQEGGPRAGEDVGTGGTGAGGAGAEGGAGTAGNAAGGASTAGSAAAGGAGASAAGGAAAGGAAASTAAAAGGTAAAAAPAVPVLVIIAVVIIIIILIIGIIFIIGPLLKTGKFGHETANATGNRGGYQTVTSLSKEEELKKSLNENVDEFIKKIENIKTNAEGKNKEQIIKLCDDILKDANELKALPVGEKTSEEDKGKKEEIKTKIMIKVKELVPLISDIVGIAAREIGVCEGTDEFSKKKYALDKRGAKAWCASFVEYVYETAGYRLTSPNNYWCPTLYTWMKNNPDKFITFEAGEAQPQPGDIVFFSWGTIHNDGSLPADMDHVGLVVNASGGNIGDSITTIEGNRGNCVQRIEGQKIVNKGGVGARYFARIK